MAWFYIQVNRLFVYKHFCLFVGIRNCCSTKYCSLCLIKRLSSTYISTLKNNIAHAFWATSTSLGLWVLHVYATESKVVIAVFPILKRLNEIHCDLVLWVGLIYSFHWPPAIPNYKMRARTLAITVWNLCENWYCTSSLIHICDIFVITWGYQACVTQSA